MTRILFCIAFFIVTVTSYGQNKRTKRVSATNTLLFVDTTKPGIESGFYMVSEDVENATARILYSCKKEDANNGQQYFLTRKEFISFAKIDSVSWMEDISPKNGFFVLDFSLDSIATKQLAKLTSNADELRLNTANGLRLGIVVNNTLIQIVSVYESIPNGKMRLAYVFNQEDVENLKRYFDKAIAVGKAGY